MRWVEKRRRWAWRLLRLVQAEAALALAADTASVDPDHVLDNITELATLHALEGEMERQLAVWEQNAEARKELPQGRVGPTSVVEAIVEPQGSDRSLQHEVNTDVAIDERSMTRATSSLRAFKVGDVLPVRLCADDMRRVFLVKGHAMSSRRFYELEQAGKFRRFELPSVIGTKAWSGAKVTRYLGVDAPTAPISPERARAKRNER